ncbi:MAG: helix-turn-helix domain-containing protein [Lachnospiraceae bacterium]|nr:helix-turn-helix domain-containing protein [Lachnospiraceae bacterium]MBP3594533.1 helix-turn-helix domain-containing protein [Lachnospiraceae bacterium]
MIQTLEEALNYISELEAENKALREELEYFRSRKPSGRKKHDDSWMASYNDFAVKYEGGMSIMEIVNQSDISRRTAYRYKAYYDEMKKRIDEKE